MLNDRTLPIQRPLYLGAVEDSTELKSEPGGLAPVWGRNVKCSSIGSNPVGIAWFS